VRAGAPIVIAFGVVALLVLSRSRPLGAVLLVITAWAAWFFRDPERTCPAEPGVLYSAADGRVMKVEELDWDWHIHGRALRVAIFLSALDVHVNRSPGAARIVASRRDPGPFAPAFLKGASERNARQLIGMELEETGLPDYTRAFQQPDGRRLVVAQIVGIMARRIVTWRLPGDSVAAGAKLGMIRFGSRTDVIVPAGLAEPLVRPGDRVIAGITPIARYLPQP
jgi:phosphatidylserine decarboxylase